MTFSSLETNYRGDSDVFANDRQGIFHKAIHVHDLDGACRTASSPPSYFSATDTGPCGDTGTQDRLETFMEEFGNNSMATIEPDNDQCSGDPAHDVFGGYAMDAGGCDSQDQYADWKGFGGANTDGDHRWDELVTDPVSTDDTSDADESSPGDSPGDLNNGLGR